jgi:hypothetical protein
MVGNPEQIGGMTMALELKKQLTLNPANPLTHAAGLSGVWQNRLSQLSGSDCRILIHKEHGQLKRLKESLGMEKATQVIEYAIQNWRKFARKAAENVGSAPFPPSPVSDGCSSIKPLQR